jgi:hypothetical protein
MGKRGRKLCQNCNIFSAIINSHWCGNEASKSSYKDIILLP